jgi:hypothetical protein
MKKIYLLGLMMVMMVFAQAQTFTVTPSNTVDSNLDPRNSLDVYIHFTNTTQSGITFAWSQTNLTHPSAWFMTVCDNRACYTLPHLRDTMAYVAPGDSGFLKVSCIPNAVNGFGTVSFDVHDINFPNDVASVTFNFNAEGATAITNSQLNDRFTVSPSPANASLTLAARGGLLDKGAVSLFDLQGHLVATQAVNALQNTEIATAELAPGIYMLRYESKAGMMTKKVVIAH